MGDPEFTEKFVAYVDILGFKKMVEAAEAGGRTQLTDLLEILKKLGTRDVQSTFREHGPSICPQSNCLQRDLGFCLTQISDCVVVSSEVSPAGVINLLGHCWGTVMSLLQSGIMCRGYITRGPIYHTNEQIIGTAYQQAYENESRVAAFKREADERGTPFVEIDRTVCDYVSECGDACVHEMFSRFVKADGTVVALFPFQRLEHSFVIAGFNQKFDADKERQSNDNVRSLVKKLKDRVITSVDASNESAVKKAAHYVAALDAQLEVCDKTDEVIETLLRPFPRGRY